MKLCSVLKWLQSFLFLLNYYEVFGLISKYRLITAATKKYCMLQFSIKECLAFEKVFFVQNQLQIMIDISLVTIKNSKHLAVFLCSKIIKTEWCKLATFEEKTQEQYKHKVLPGKRACCNVLKKKSTVKRSRKDSGFLFGRISKFGRLLVAIFFKPWTNLFSRTEKFTSIRERVVKSFHVNLCYLKRKNVYYLTRNVAVYHFLPDEKGMHRVATLAINFGRRFFH